MRTIVCFLISAAATYGAEADPAKTERSVRKNLPYAKAKVGQRRFRALDVYSPASGTGHPVMVYIHGGAWRAGDKRAVHKKPDAFVKNGYVFVSINYRLYPQADWRAQAADVAAAIKHVHAHVDKVGGDSRRIFLMGHSAGAHLAALVATDAQYLKSAGLNLSAVKGVVLLDGAGYDIPTHLKTAATTARKLYETIFGIKEADQIAASPATHVKKGTGIPPFLIIHVASRAASRTQSHLLAEAIRKIGVKAEVVAAKNKTHGTLNRELGTANDEPTRAVFRFLKSVKPSTEKSKS